MGYISYIYLYSLDSLDFLFIWPREVDEDTEIAMFDIISLHTSIHNEFGVEAFDYFID